MKISKIKISNLFTFPYLDWFSSKKWIVFDAREKSNFNILIGPNWSGKTSFLYIISQIFSNGLIKQYHYDKSIIDKSITNKIDEVITLKKKKIEYLEKHHSSLNKSSKIWVTFKLNQYDFENIWFICNYSYLLNNVIKKYSKLDIKFVNHNLYDIIFENEIYLEFIVNTKNGTIKVDNYKALSNKMKFVLFYIENMELIQICMNIYNDFERKPNQRKLYPLKNTFALLDSERSMFCDNIWKHKMFNIDSIAERSLDIETSKLNKFESVIVWYDLFIIKLIKLAKEELFSKWKEYLNVSVLERGQAIKSSKFFHEVEYFINKLLKLRLDIKIEDDNSMNLVFKNLRWSVFYFDKLSSWEKSIIMMLISLFWYDLSNWLFIVDEPELHLHPYMLRNVFEVLKDICHKLNVQFICATHSPLLIDEQSINNVYKFSFVDGKTVVHYPEGPVYDHEATLIHILKFEHVSKIFFINRIIMVEWETDEYFWKFFLNYLSKKPEYEWKIEDYEILNINWKWSYKKWSKFLKRFGIDSYFIWDWDNTIENNIIDYQEMTEYIQLTKQYFDKDYIKKQKLYIEVIETIKKFFPEKYDYIIRKINSFYDKWIFILAKWDLEAYLWMKTKGLEDTIRFCNRDFYSWLNNKELESHYKEFKNIVDHIFLSK